MIKFKGAICSSYISGPRIVTFCAVVTLKLEQSRSLKLVMTAYTIHLLSEKIKLHIQAFDKVGQILKIADSHCFINIKQ